MQNPYPGRSNDAADARLDSFATEASPVATERSAPVFTTVLSRSHNTADAAGTRVRIPASGPAAPPISLEIVVARRTPVQWPEAVAVIERVCAELLRTDGTEMAAPDLPGISLRADGGVEVRGGGDGSSVGRLSRALHTLTSTATVPPPLRLLIAKWIAATEPHTIRQFATELGYFARPDPASLIRALYERCLAMPVVEPERDAPVAAEIPKPKAQRKRAPAWLLPVAALSAAAATGTWMWMQPGPPGAPREASRAQEGTADAPKIAAATARPVAAASETRPTSAAPAAVPADTARRASESPQAPRSEARSSVATAAALLRGGPPASGSGRSGAASAAGTRPGAPLAVFEETVVPGTGIPPVYSSSDADVSPPKMLYPALPPPVFRGPGDMNTMEVVVSPAGVVETVRLVSLPRRLTDMMLLSGAKTWRFAPAQRDGYAVRYRMMVSWAATP